jgi:hypothetical protein
MTDFLMIIEQFEADEEAAKAIQEVEYTIVDEKKEVKKCAKKYTSPPIKMSKLPSYKPLFLPKKTKETFHNKKENMILDPIFTVSYNFNDCLTWNPDPQKIKLQNM